MIPVYQPGHRGSRRVRVTSVGLPYLHSGASVPGVERDESRRLGNADVKGSRGTGTLRVS